MIDKKTVLAYLAGYIGGVILLIVVGCIVAFVPTKHTPKPMGNVLLEQTKLAVVEDGDTAAFGELAGIYSRERNFNFYPYARLMAERYEYAPAGYWVYRTLADRDTLEADLQELAVRFLRKAAASGDTAAVAELARMEAKR